MRFPKRRLRQRLPAVTAAVLAALVALSASIDDGRGGASTASSGRVTASLAASGRVLASALSTVAGRIEIDWSSQGRRLQPTMSSPIALACANRVARLPDVALATESERRDDERSHALDSSKRVFRALLNLPPPSIT